MRTQGSLTTWNTDRGFGFIRTRDSGIEVFVHVSEFPRSGRTPQIGDVLHFEITTDPKGRKRAKAVAFDTPLGGAELTLAPIERAPAAPTSAASDPRTVRQAPRHDARRETLQRDSLHRDRPRRESSGLASKVVVGTLLFGGAVFAYQKFASLQTSAVDMPQIQSAQTSAAPVAANNYVCDGRQHCSQMRSCEEATWFIRNCPNTKMDGEGDGIPCEQQHCN